MNTGGFGKERVYSFMQDENWCLLVYKGVYTRILMEKRGFTDIAVKTGVI